MTTQQKIKSIYDRRQKAHDELLKCDVELDAILKSHIKINNSDKKDTVTIIDDGKLKTSELLYECRELFPVYCYLSDEELDKQFPPVKSEMTRSLRSMGRIISI